MQSLFEKLHWFVFGYTLFLVWDMYSVHEEKVFDLNLRIPEIEVKIKKSKKKVSNIKKYFNDIENAKRNIERVALEVEKVQKRLPSEIADSENLKLITDLSRSLNIQEVFIKPEDEIDKGFYFIKDYVFNGEGTYLQFLVFFEKIAVSKRLLNIKAVDFEYIQGRKQRARYKLVKGTVTVQAYRYNSNFKESRGIEEIESEFKNKQRDKRRKKKKGKKK